MPNSIDLLGYKQISVEELSKVESLLADSTIIDINSEIKKIVVELRKSNKILIHSQSDQVPVGKQGFGTEGFINRTAD